MEKVDTDMTRSIIGLLLLLDSNGSIITTLDFPRTATLLNNWSHIPFNPAIVLCVLVGPKVLLRAVFVVIVSEH